MTLLLSLLLGQALAAIPGDVGVLLIAHGGDRRWDGAIAVVSKSVDTRGPIELALGMADGDELQKAVDKLEAGGVRKIVAVPLFVSSHSSLYRQTEYLLGAKPKPSKEFMDSMIAMEKEMGAMGGHMGHSMGAADNYRHRVHAKVPIKVAPALDADPLVADILSERTKRLSTKPGNEALVLVAHGPVEEDDDQDWLADLGKLADEVKSRIGLSEASAATIRDDAPKPIRDAAVQRLRSLVAKLSWKHDVIIVPVLVAQGGIEAKLKKDLSGLRYRWSGRTLAPDPRLSRWIEKRVEEAP